MDFVITDQPAVQHQPAEGPLDHPAARQHLEPFPAGFFGDDLGVDPALGRMCEKAGFVPRIHPGLGHGRMSGGELIGQNLAAVGVLHRCSGDDQREQQSERIGGNVPLAAFIRLAASMPWRSSPTFGEVLTAWASMRAALGCAARPALTRALTRSRSWICPVVLSFAHMLKYVRCLARREIMRKQVPCTARPVHPQDGVGDLSQIMGRFLDPDPVAGGPPPGQDRLYQRPALIGQVG